jgi:hypothetical protein
MKAILLLLTLLMFGPLAWAQDEEPPVVMDQEARERIDAARAAYITERLGLTTEEAEKFWPIYREFASKRLAIRQEYRDARKSGKNDEELVDLGLKLKQQEVDLERDYSGRMLRIISAQKLMELRGAERDFTRLVLQQIQQRQLMQERRQQMRDRQQQQQQRRNN